MPVQQQPAASEGLSGIGMAIKSVNTLREAGFSQDQALALAEAISGMISANMKPFMDETNRRFQAVEDQLKSMNESIDGRLTSVEGKVDWLQKVMVTFAATMGGSVVALTALFFGVVR